MILRVVLGSLPAGTDAAALVEARGRLERTAHDVHGLESLIVGARRRAGRGSDAGDIEAAIISVWRDVDSMVRATGIDEQDRFLAASGMSRSVTSPSPAATACSSVAGTNRRPPLRTLTTRSSPRFPASRGEARPGRSGPAGTSRVTNGG